MPPVDDIFEDPTFKAIRQQFERELRATKIPKNSVELISFDEQSYYRILNLIAMHGPRMLKIPIMELNCISHIMRIQHAHKRTNVTTFELGMNMNRSYRTIERYIKRLCELELISATPIRYVDEQDYDLAPLFAKFSHIKHEVCGNGH